MDAWIYGLHQEVPTYEVRTRVPAVHKNVRSTAVRCTMYDAAAAERQIGLLQI